MVRNVIRRIVVLFLFLFRSMPVKLTAMSEIDIIVKMFSNSILRASSHTNSFAEPSVFNSA